jgi:D-alanine-D-alanine ligase
MPANISPELYNTLKNLAHESCHILNIRGLCRVDFFLDNDTGLYYLNELNTMPELTSDSMFSSLWKTSGIEYSLLLDRLIDFARQENH